mmetsp:Transcript_77002/g.229466  ORF Transcript_77002/g.229466 Transcript_77002/m.229466 type:complete len:122 (+) Transcript_77002:707-1072(+)
MGRSGPGATVQSPLSAGTAAGAPAFADGAAKLLPLTRTTGRPLFAPSAAAIPAGLREEPRAATGSSEARSRADPDAAIRAAVKVSGRGLQGAPHCNLQEMPACSGEWMPRGERALEADNKP